MRAALTLVLKELEGADTKASFDALIDDVIGASKLTLVSAPSFLQEPGVALRASTPPDAPRRLAQRRRAGAQVRGRLRDRSPATRRAARW